MTDVNAAKEAARRLYKRVNYSDGPLGTYELSSLLTDTYNFLKIPFKPTQNDIKIYEQILDADRDGKVTLKDLEARAAEYLCSNTLISSIQNSSQSSFKKSDIQDQNQNKYGVSQTANYQTSYSQPSSAQPINYTQYSQNTYASKDLDQASYNYNYKASFQSRNETQINNQRSLSNLGGNQTLYSYEKNSNFSQSGYEIPPSQQSDRSFQYSYTGNEYGGNYVNQSYAPNQEYNQGDTQPKEEIYESSGNQYQQRPYSQTVRQYLSVVGQVFMRYADPVEYTVTQAEVADLLRDTYAVLGRQGYNPSRDDVQTWMKLCDVNQDGKVEFQEYEYFVVKSLERSGLDLYE